MQTTNSRNTKRLGSSPSSSERESILAALEEYRTLLYEPLPAAEVNERLLQSKIDALLDQLHRLPKGTNR